MSPFDSRRDEGGGLRVAVYEIRVGTVRVIDGVRVDHTRPLRFEAQKLATRTQHIDSECAHGITETLYYTADERLIVHVKDWSERPEDATISFVLEVSREDLRSGARFEALGQAAWAWLRG